MLDYTHSGTAKVKVEYVGRAPLDGHDEEYLVASYRPGNRAPDPSDGLPEGVMIAMNGPTPSGNEAGQALAFPGELTTSVSPEATVVAFNGEGSALPELGPIVPERPAFEAIPETILIASAAMSYAGSRTSPTQAAFEILEPGASLTPSAIVASWKRRQAEDRLSSQAAAPYIAAGTFETETDAALVASRLESVGAVEIEVIRLEGATRYSVNLRVSSASELDATLQAAWDGGAADAFVVRD
jgi:rare lipoprotein A